MSAILVLSPLCYLPNFVCILESLLCAVGSMLVAACVAVDGGFTLMLIKNWGLGWRGEKRKGACLHTVTSDSIANTLYDSPELLGMAPKQNVETEQ